jgi:hypothetical protein
MTTHRKIVVVEQMHSRLRIDVVGGLVGHVGVCVLAGGGVDVVVIAVGDRLVRGVDRARFGVPGLGRLSGVTCGLVCGLSRPVRRPGDVGDGGSGVCSARFQWGAMDD